MVRFIKIVFILAGISCFYFLPQTAMAKNKILTEVRVIHASTASNTIDPSLRKIIPELKSVFKYTAYRLLKDEQLTQNFKEKSRVSLPGKRALIIMPSEMKGRRIRYQIHIQKNQHSVFQTQVLLKNNSSITIGGPQFKNGVLLLNISGSVQ